MTESCRRGNPTPARGIDGRGPDAVPSGTSFGIADPLGAGRRTERSHAMTVQTTTLVHSFPGSALS
jgi:hypothetical protein